MLQLYLYSNHLADAFIAVRKLHVILSARQCKGGFIAATEPYMFIFRLESGRYKMLCDASRVPTEYEHIRLSGSGRVGLRRVGLL
jgi:hypothetical protein